MIRVILLFLFLFPAISWADSESSIGGRIGTAHIVQDEGTSLRPRPYLNFTGAGVSAADSGGKTVVTIAGGGGSGSGDITSVGSCSTGDCLSGSGAITLDTVEANTSITVGGTAVLTSETGDIERVGDCLSGECLVTGGNITSDTIVTAWLSDAGNLALDLNDDGSDLILHANVGGVNSLFIETDGTFLELVANPGPSNDDLMFSIEETQGDATQINFYEGAAGNNRFWSSGSGRFGGAVSSLCSTLTSDVDCDTAGTGADILVQDDIWAGGKVFASDWTDVSITASQISDQNAGTDITADLEEETHAAEHASGGGDAVDHDTLTNFVAAEHADVTGIDFLVGTATATLSAEIVAGTAPGGELGGTWGTPTVDATHSGSAHHDAVTFAGTGTYISLSGQEITVDPITESDISDLTHTADEVGTLTSGKWCTTDGSVVNCTEDAPAGTGDITRVGDCLSGDCLVSSGNITVDTVNTYTFDQSVANGATPTFSADNFSDGGSNAIITTTQETNFETAYTHSQDNTQAHSDYLLNSESDTMTGTLTADGLTLGQDENITLGTQTLDHDGTDFVFSDSITTDTVKAGAGGITEGSGVVYNSTEAATGILSGTWANPGIDADGITHAEILDVDQADSKGFNYFESDGIDNEDDFQSVWFNGTANDFQVTEIWCETDTGSVTGILQLDDGTPADCDTVDLVCAATAVEDTSLDGDCLVAAGERLDWLTSSTATTPLWLRVFWTGNWVD